MAASSRPPPWKSPPFPDATRIRDAPTIDPLRADLETVSVPLRSGRGERRQRHRGDRGTGGRPRCRRGVWLVASRRPGRARWTGVPRLWGCGRPVHARRADLGTVDRHHKGRAAHRWLSRLEHWRLQPRPRPRRTGCQTHHRLSRRSHSKRSRSLQNLNSEKVRATPCRAPPLPASRNPLRANQDSRGVVARRQRRAFSLGGIGVLVCAGAARSRSTRPCGRRVGGTWDPSVRDFSGVLAHVDP